MALALSVPPGGLPFPEVLDYAKEAESLGYESCWVAEVGGNDAFAMGTAIGSVTEHMRIGTAVAPMQTRGPALLAMAAATMDSMSGGRGICGIGVSSPQIVADWNDRPYDRPIRRARETIDFLRRAFAGEKVTYDGGTIHVNGYRMMPGPRRPVPVYLGALNKQMLRLAGRTADGVVINMLGEDFVPTVVAEARKGAEEAGRDPDALEVVMRVQCVVGEDTGMVRDAFARAFGAYIIAPGYDSFFTWQGFGDVVEGVKKAFASKDREASRAAVSDELLDALCVAGTAGEVRARLNAFMDAGVTTPAMHAFWPTPDAAWRTMRALAPNA